MASIPPADAGGQRANAAGDNATNATDGPIWTYREGVAVPRNVARVRVHSSIAAIPERAFRNCHLLKEVILPEGLRRIGAMAFISCSSLETVIFPSTLVHIGKIAFRCCTSLSVANLPEGLKRVGRAAFAGCRSLHRITLPSTLEDVDSEAFALCTSLTEVTLTGGILNIEEEVFDRCCSLDQITIPSRAFVFKGGRRDGRLVTNGTVEISPFSDGRMTIIAPERLASITLSKMMWIRGTISTIIRGYESTEPKFERVRALIAYHSSLEVSTMLELALWKKKMDECGGADDNDRGECRFMCGADANVIVPNVLSYL